MSRPENTYWFDQRYEDELLHQHRTNHVDVAKPLSCHWCADELRATRSLNGVGDRPANI